MINSVKVRFAPSPTGYLHIGGLRTALYNYLFAKQNNGKIILRIEDTDQSRIVKGAAENLINIFNEFNITFDDGPQNVHNGDSYFQSNRINFYSKYSEYLLKNGNAYKCYLTPDELNNLRKDAEQLKEGAQYLRNKIRYYAENNQSNSDNYVIRLKVPDNETIIFNDCVRGKVKFSSNEIDDQILIKADGFPTYHLANVVDDYEMGITHVIRGEEWLSSTPKHKLLYNALGFDCPEFAHLPLLLNTDKTKLSKRQGDVSVEDFLNAGYHPDAIINFISLLGWHPENDNEMLTMNDLISSFSINRVQKGGAVFDIEKLNWINSQYIKNLTFENFIHSAAKYFPKYAIGNDIKNKKIFDIIKSRIKTFNDINDEMKMFYNKLEFNNEDYKVLLEKNNRNIFNFWIEHLLNNDTIDNDMIYNLLKLTEEKFKIKGKDLFFPMRLLLYGKAQGPSIPSICNILGRDEILIRLNNVINKT